MHNFENEWKRRRREIVNKIYLLIIRAFHLLSITFELVLKSGQVGLGCSTLALA